MGNGAIQISITVYPDLDGGEKYNKSVTRTINIDHLGGLAEMDRIAYTLGEMTTATLNAMIGTLYVRTSDEAKAAAVADDEANCPSEPEPEDEGPGATANHVDAWR